MASERSIVVYGAGAVGCYLGARLARAGHQVTLVGRPRVVEATESHGLILREDGAEVVVHPAVTTSSAGLPSPDLVILAVRAYDVAPAISDVRALLEPFTEPLMPVRGGGAAGHGRTGPTGHGSRHVAGGIVGGGGVPVLAMQNGVGSEEQLAEALGRERVLAGTLTITVGMEEPGSITRHSARGGVALSTMSGAPVPDWIVDAYTGAGFETALAEDYRSLRWSKLLLNMLGAATSAILDIDMAQIAESPSLFRLEQLASREAGRVMDAQRIRTVSLPGYPVSRLRLAMRLPRFLAQRVIGPRLIGARRGRSPGARAEMRRGRSEVPYLNGAVAAAAARLGSHAPVNAALTALVQELLSNPERRDEFRGRPERLLDYMREQGVTV